MGGIVSFIEDVVGGVVDLVEDVVDLVVDVIETVVDVVVDIVEAVVELAADLLGFGDDQVVTLFEVYNYPLFNETKNNTSLNSIILESLLQNIGVSENILYYAAQRNLKTDLKKLVQYIDDGNYIEDFARIESFIFYVNQDEIVDAIVSFENTPVTIISEKLFGLPIYDWVNYWMFANKGMDLNSFQWQETIGGTLRTLTAQTGVTSYTLATDTYEMTSTYGTQNDITPDPVSPDPSTFTPGEGETEVFFTSISLDKTFVTDGGFLTVTLEADIDIVADATNFSVSGGNNIVVTGSGTQLVTATIEVNSDPGDPVTISWAGITGVDTTEVFADWQADTVYVQEFEAATNEYVITIPSKPPGLHYIVRYYLDSDPSVTKMFVYRVGEGTYPDLDNPNTSLDIDADIIKAIPPIPLRVNNTNYTSRSQSDIDKIEGIGKFIGLDMREILDGVMTDPSVVGNEDKLDHVYLNFGVRLSDTSHPAKKYMYNVCENLFPSQAVTKAIHDSTIGGDTTPQNNIIITANEYRYLFQWSYITYQNYTLSEINADPNSVINGLYYSDLSKFDAANNLKFVYFVSSREGTYNVQYIADSVGEVDQFIAGTLPSEADYSTDGAGLLQTRSKFRWTAGVIYESDGVTVYRDDYLRPTLAYQKQGANLKLVNRIPESVTVKQEISYYRCAPDGMTGYTIKAPIGAFRVVDGATGEFRMVKFNLANENDLMFPLLFDKISDLSQAEVTQIFTMSAHVSMYVANVEVIEVSFWQKLLYVIIIVLVIYFAWQFAVEFSAALEAGTTAAFLSAAAGTVAKQMLIRYIAQELAGDDPILAALLMIGGQFVDFGFGSTMELSNLSGGDYATLFAAGADGMSNVYLKRVEQGYQDLETEQEAVELRRRELTDQLTNARQLLGPAHSNPAYENVALYTIETAWTTEITPRLPSDYLEMNANIRYDMPYLQMEAGLIYDHIFNSEQQLYTS